MYIHDNKLHLLYVFEFILIIYTVKYNLHNIIILK